MGRVGRPPQTETYKRWAKMLDAGLTRTQIAEREGVTYNQLAYGLRALGIRGKRGRHVTGPSPRTVARDKALIAMAQDTYRPLAEIGQAFGISRERARQILDAYRVTRPDRPRPLTQAAMVEARLARVEAALRINPDADDVAAQLGVDVKAVMNLARSRGIPTIRPHRDLYKALAACVRYPSLLSALRRRDNLTAWGRTHGVGTGAVYRWQKAVAGFRMCPGADEVRAAESRYHQLERHYGTRADDRMAWLADHGGHTYAELAEEWDCTYSVVLSWVRVRVARGTLRVGVGDYASGKRRQGPRPHRVYVVKGGRDGT